MTRRLCAFVFAVLFIGVALPARAGGGYSAHAVDNRFEPATVTMPPGNQFVWLNAGKVPHDITAVDGSFASGNLNPGQEFDFTFSKAGTYAYYCKYHGTATSGMRGTIVVSASAHPRTGGGNEIELGLLVLAATAVVGVALRSTRAAR